MKYFIIVFVTAVIVFLGATVYYKGLPRFISPRGVSVVSNEELATTIPIPTPTPSTDDLLAKIKAALIKKYGQNDADMNVTVSTVSGEYAKGMVTEQGGGGMWLAARQDGIWTLVWDGNGIITCDDISPFPGFPTSLVPECWDTAAEKLITR